MHRLCVGILLATLAPQLAAQDSPAALPSFAIVLGQTGGRWTAECETGCTWTKLAIDCGRNCTPVIDQHGVYRSARGDRQASTFAFTVRTAGNGVAATTLQGTAWRALSGTCGDRGCQVRITERGIEVPATRGRADDA